VGRVAGKPVNDADDLRYLFFPASKRGVWRGWRHWSGWPVLRVSHGVAARNAGTVCRADKHAFLFQHPDEFGRQVVDFLAAGAT
jgi:hypothetical protein